MEEESSINPGRLQISCSQSVTHTAAETKDSPLFDLFAATPSSSPKGDLSTSSSVYPYPQFKEIKILFYNNRRKPDTTTFKTVVRQLNKFFGEEGALESINKLPMFDENSNNLMKQGYIFITNGNDECVDTISLKNEIKNFISQNRNANEINDFIKCAIEKYKNNVVNVVDFSNKVTECILKNLDKGEEDLDKIITKCFENVSNVFVNEDALSSVIQNYIRKYPQSVFIVFSANASRVANFKKSFESFPNSSSQLFAFRKGEKIDEESITKLISYFKKLLEIE